MLVMIHCSCLISHNTFPNNPLSCYLLFTSHPRLQFQFSLPSKTSKEAPSPAQHVFGMSREFRRTCRIESPPPMMVNMPLNDNDSSLGNRKGTVAIGGQPKDAHGAD